jgi:hypothetical protein
MPSPLPLSGASTSASLAAPPSLTSLLSVLLAVNLLSPPLNSCKASSPCWKIPMVKTHTHGVCLKTGCQLILAGQAFWGDLFQFNEQTYIFNAVIDDNGWPCSIPEKSPEFCSLSASADVFERRGLFVISIASARPNDALRDYLSASPYAR